MAHLRVFLGVFVLCLFLAAEAKAITWFPQDFTCPIDGQKNTFLVVGSYGSYIYDDPSKYQWLFFPRTDSPTFYLCKKCHLATFMWDFDSLPKDKLPAIKEALKDVKVSKGFKEYTEISVPERLEIMQKVYAVLDKNDEWWEDFYRIKGYHYGASGNKAKADEARAKSLELLAKLNANGKSEIPQKMLLYISGAMKHFTGDDQGAIKDLETALTVKLVESSLSGDELKAADEGVNERIKDYLGLLRSGKDLPRTKEKNDGHSH